MNAIIPDTLEGALILSVIDFVASFVVIAGIGGVLGLFPLLNRVVRVGREAQPADVYTEKVDFEAEDHIAAIAAAVHATMAGAYRIVHIEPTHRGEGWVAEGRLAHHTSHARHGAGTVPPADR